MMDFGWIDDMTNMTTGDVIPLEDILECKYATTYNGLQMCFQSKKNSILDFLNDRDKQE